MLPTVAMQLRQPIKLSKLWCEIYLWEAVVQDCGAKRLGFAKNYLSFICKDASGKYQNAVEDNLEFSILTIKVGCD